MIVGRSVHNQRIERLWCDIWDGVTSLYYQIFYHMEEQGILDPLNELHFFALHFVFIPCINMHLSDWVEAWSNHSLRSLNFKTPLQLWIEGTMNNFDDEPETINEVYITFQGQYLLFLQNVFGVDPCGPLPDTIEADNIAIPMTCLPLTEEQ